MCVHTVHPVHKCGTISDNTGPSYIKASRLSNYPYDPGATTSPRAGSALFLWDISDECQTPGMENHLLSHAPLFCGCPTCERRRVCDYWIPYLTLGRDGDEIKADSWVLSFIPTHPSGSSAQTISHALSSHNRGPSCLWAQWPSNKQRMKLDDIGTRWSACTLHIQYIHTCITLHTLMGGTECLRVVRFTTHTYIYGVGSWRLSLCHEIMLLCLVRSSLFVFFFHTKNNNEQYPSVWESKRKSGWHQPFSQTSPFTCSQKRDEAKVCM